MAWADGGRDNAGLNAAREALHPLADRCRDLTKQIDLAAKLAGRVIDIAVKELDARDSDALGQCRGEPGAQGAGGRAGRGGRGAAAGALFRASRPTGLQERFPDARLRDVEGLVKLVDRAEIAAHDWSLTPGRYVGVAPEEMDEDFDFEEALRVDPHRPEGAERGGGGTGGTNRSGTSRSWEREYSGHYDR